MSPGLAILCCAMVELNMEPRPAGLIRTVVRFMDDVFGIYAQSFMHREGSPPVPAV